MHSGVIIALLPSDAIEDEHMTLVYCGDIERLVTAPVSVMQETCSRLSMIFQPFSAYVTGHDIFGPSDDRVEVATIDAPMIWTMRHCVESFHMSQFGLRPHITKVGANPLRGVGSSIGINRIALWYGEHREEFRLGGNRPLYTMR
jgi:hypothetical protein